jgi:hypothetical protein
MDFSTFMPSTYQGPQYCLVAIDAMSRYAMASACNAADSKSALRFFDELVASHGVPEEIVTDAGTHFVNSAFRDHLSALHTHHHATTPHAKTGNGLAERLIQSLQAIIAKKKATDQRTWSAILPFAVVAYNSTVHRSIDATPYEVHHGSKRATSGREFEDNPPLHVYWAEINARTAAAQATSSPTTGFSRTTTCFRPGDLVFIRDTSAMSLRQPKIGLPNTRLGVISALRPPKAALIRFDNTGREHVLPTCMLQPRIADAPTIIDRPVPADLSPRGGVAPHAPAPPPQAPALPPQAPAPHPDCRALRPRLRNGDAPIPMRTRARSGAPPLQMNHMQMCTGGQVPVHTFT